MFCTQCGTQVEQGKNFCRNCGASLKQFAEPATAGEGYQTEATPTANSVASRRANPVSANSMEQRTPFPAARERKGMGAMIIVAAAVVLVVAAGAGIYFGTGLFREPAKPEPPAVVAETPPAPSAQSPGSTLWEDAKQSSEAADNNLATAPQSSQPEPPPAPAQLPKPPQENLSKPTPARRPQPPPAEQDAQGLARDTQPPVPAPASRRVASAGTYETLRSTPVFESPSPSARVVANIPGGIRVNVVGSTGGWLEVHSKRGNPPGFIRRQDATFVEKAE